MAEYPTPSNPTLTAAEMLAYERAILEERRKFMVEKILRPFIDKLQEEGTLPPTDYKVEYKD